MGALVVIDTWRHTALNLEPTLMADEEKSYPAEIVDERVEEFWQPLGAALEDAHKREPPYGE